MKKITLFFTMLFTVAISWHGIAQIDINETLESGRPTGWTQTGGVFSNSNAAYICEGSGNLEDNMYGSVINDGTLTSNNYTGASNGTDVTVTYQWNARPYLSNAVDFTIDVEYSIDDGTNWNSVSSYTVSTTTPCTTYSQVIPAASVPTGSDFKFRISGHWISGDSYHYIDDLHITQVATAVPNCDSVLVETTNIALDGAISWSVATGLAIGYKVMVGTASGANDILATTDVGNVTMYNVGTLTAGATYYTTITSYNTIGDATGCTEQTFATIPLPPANDDCGGAIALTVNTDLNCGTVTSGTINQATASGVDGTACTGTENDDVWFSFVATATIQRVSLTNIAGTPTDLYHSLWEGGCGSLTLVAASCSDGNTSNPAGLTVGNTYYVRVNSYSAGTGAVTTFDVCVGTPPPPPANDECTNAITISCGNNLAGQTTMYATGGASTSCQGSIGNDVWYTFVGDGARVSIEINSTTTGEEVQIDVYASTDGTCAGFTAGTCDGSLVQSSGGSNPYTATFDSVVGTTYFIAVGNWVNNNPGIDFDLSVACETCVEVNNIAASNFVGTNADLTWDTAANATGYNWEIQPQGTAQGDGALVESGTVATNTATATALVDGTDYTLYVQTDCGGGSTSNYTSYDFTYNLPPANDDCGGAIALTVNADLNCGTVTSATILGATASGVDETACGGTENNDVWFSFVATAASQRINLRNIAGTPTDLYHSLWEGGCGSLTLVSGTCSDPNASNPTRLTVGNTYYVRVNSWNSASGATTTFDVCIGTPPPPPANDECTGAIDLTVNADLNCGTVTSATVEWATASGVNEGTCFGTENDDVWFSFVATDVKQRISLTNIAGTPTDLYHSLWEGTCGSLTSVSGTCSDGNTSNPSGLTVGNTYYVRVNSYSSSLGATTTFDVCVGTHPPPPANDDCANAITINESTDSTCDNMVSGTTVSATNSSDYSTACSSTYEEVWYVFTPSTTGYYAINRTLTNGTANTYLSIWTGTCGSLTQVNSSCSTTALDESLTAGTQYYISVASSTATVDFDLCVYLRTTHCIPSSSSSSTSSSTYIDTFTTTNGVANISNAATGFTTGYYADYYDTMNVSGQPASTFDFNVEIVGGTVGCAIWVDWNNDLNFDTATETVFNTISYGGGPFTGTVTIPSGTANGDYTMRVMIDYNDPNPNDNACIIGSSRGEVEDYKIVVDNTLSTNNAIIEGFTYYPNPVNDKLSLQAKENIDNVEIMNLLGQTVYRISPKNTSTTIDMSSIKEGAYFVRIQVGNATKTIKVLKK